MEPRWSRENFPNYTPSIPRPSLPFCGSNTYVTDSWKRNRLLLSSQLSRATSITDIMRVGMFFFSFFEFSHSTASFVSPTEKNRDFPVFFCAIPLTTVQHAIRICYTSFALPINPRAFYSNKKLKKEEEKRKKDSWKTVCLITFFLRAHKVQNDKKFLILPMH